MEIMKMSNSPQTVLENPASGELLFRRQYIIAPHSTRTLEGWSELDIGNGYLASAHPHLNTTVARYGDRTIILLGYLLDPVNPHQNDEEIAERLVKQASSFTLLLKELKPLGGRYAIIFSSPSCTRIFSDPAGFRELCYFMDGDGKWWVSSQASLMAEFHPLGKNEKALEDLGRLDLFRNTMEYWFPGKITPYEGVNHLTPNHYFDFESGQTARFWPTEDLKTISSMECIEESARLLKGIMRSAVNRFDLALAVTGGLDTRVLLAASRDVADQMLLFTHTLDTLAESNADIAIPRDISDKYGLDYDVVKHTNDIPEEYSGIFNRNITYARPNKLINTFSIQRHFLNRGKDYVVANGVCGEITRCFHRLPPFIKISPRVLAVLVGMKGSSIAEEEFGSWLSDLKGMCPDGYDFLDLYYWENRNANWAAMSYHEYDTGFESLSPFNCRQLLETFLRTERSLRLPPSYSLHRELIKHMWPDLMDWPINPPETTKERLVAGLKGSRFYEYLRMARLIKRCIL